MATPSLRSVLETANGRPGLACFDTAHGETIVTWGEGPRHTALDGWQGFVRNHTLPNVMGDSRYTGGVVGWFGYEAGSTVERMPQARGARATHDVCLWRTEGSLVLHRDRGQWTVHGRPDFCASGRLLLAAAESAESHPPKSPGPQDWVPPHSDRRSENFKRGVKRILNHIAAGDVYQVSLAWEQSCIPVEDPLHAWLEVRESNPAARGCYLHSQETCIISNSPELFLEFNARQRTVRSIPIKGTAQLAEGEAGRNRLVDSPKERAELTMIVDLVRNDLGRVAKPGTVRASERTIRQCGDLWHAEQTVEAEVPNLTDAVDLISASFPPGSVTGAPKVRAMEVIDDLEDGPRGVYTGAIGWFADGGGMHFNVAIRTATVVDGVGRFHVGAGIVADSEPEAEWCETLAKARALAGVLHQ